MDDGLPHPLRRWHLLPSPILDEYFCKVTKFFVKIFLQVLLFPCNLCSLQPLCDTQEALGKYSRRTILSSKKLSFNSAFGEKNISLIKYSYKKNLAHSGLRSSSNSLIQYFAHPKTLSKHLVEVRNRRSQGSPKSWQSEQPCDFALFHGNLEARKSWAKLPLWQATWLCTLPRNTVEIAQVV